MIFSYALPAISPGPVLTILSLYLNGRLGLTQAEVNQLAWIPPLTWGIGYFFWGWAADRYAANNRRPVGWFAFFSLVSLTLGFTTWECFTNPIFMHSDWRYWSYAFFAESLSFILAGMVIAMAAVPAFTKRNSIGAAM